jgi:hypothetical protein
VADALNADLQQRVAALVAASGGRVWVVSGFRSVERQQQLWDAAVRKYGSVRKARKWVAPPGKSNHNKGEAVDLGGDLRLARQLAARFGFVAPMGHEPWHFERAGFRSQPDAHTEAPVMMANGAGMLSPVAVPSTDPHSIEYQAKNLLDVLTATEVAGADA